MPDDVLTENALIERAEDYVLAWIGWTDTAAAEQLVAHFRTVATEAAAKALKDASNEFDAKATSGLPNCDWEEGYVTAMHEAASIARRLREGR